MSLFLVKVVFSATLIVLFQTVKVSAYDGFSLSKPMALSIGVFLICVLIVAVAAITYWYWRKRRVKKGNIYRISAPLSDVELEETMLKLQMATQQSSSTDTETVGIERETTPKYTMSNHEMPQDDPYEISQNPANPQNPAHLSRPETECGAEPAPIEMSDVIQHVADYEVTNDNDPVMSTAHEVSQVCFDCNDHGNDDPVYDEFPQDDPKCNVNDNEDPEKSVPVMLHTTEISQEDPDCYINDDHDPVYDVPKMTTTNEHDPDCYSNDDDDPVYDVPKMITTNEDKPDCYNDDDDDPVYEVPKMSIINDILQDDLEIDDTPGDRPTILDSGVASERLLREDKNKSSFAVDGLQSVDPEESNNGKYIRDSGHSSGAGEINTGFDEQREEDSNNDKEIRNSSHSSSAGKIDTGFHESNSAVYDNPQDSVNIQQDVLNQNMDNRDSGNISESSDVNEKTTSSTTEKKLQLANPDSTNSQDEASAGDEGFSYVEMSSPMDIQTIEKNKRRKGKDGSSDWELTEESSYEEMSYNLTT